MKALRKLLALGAVLLFMAGCASIGPPMPPSLELPKEPTDLRAARKGDKVTLTWTVPEHTTERQKVRLLGKTNICRNMNAVLKQCGTPVEKVAPPAKLATTKKSSPQKIKASFVDRLNTTLELEHPAGFADYAVEVMNEAGKSAGLSNQVHVPLVPTLPAFAGFAARTAAQGIVVSWLCPLTQASYGGKYLFRIYRRLESTSTDTKIADVNATECARGPKGLVPLTGQINTTAKDPVDQGEIVTSFLDQTIDWEKTYLYRGTVVSVVEAAEKSTVEVEGDDTPEVKIFAHDIFPPAVPAGLQAVFSGPGQQPFIDLIWAPVADADLAGYNIYRHEAGAEPVKLNAEPVQAPAFRDAQVMPGKTYFYSVTAVDQRGNESRKSEEASEKAEIL